MINLSQLHTSPMLDPKQERSRQQYFTGRMAIIFAKNLFNISVHKSCKEFFFPTVQRENKCMNLLHFCQYACFLHVVKLALITYMSVK